jgi:hypothetical protein
MDADDSIVSADQTLRGYGAESALPTKPECRLVELALKERWVIPDSTREAMIKQFSLVLEQPDIIRTKPRLFLAAAK